MIDPTELGSERIARFLAIRASKLIGPLWIVNGQFALSENATSIMSSDADTVSLSTVIRRIDYWFPGHASEAPLRKMEQKEQWRYSQNVTGKSYRRN